MEAAEAKEMKSVGLDTQGAVGRLNSVFGAVRAEYFREEIFDLFTHPSYFPQLQTIQPCILVGGRGTGKTTVLKCLSYEGQSRLNPTLSISDWTSVGLYWRIDTSIVRTFEGPELESTQWDRLFIHYVNLTLTQMVLDFIKWAGESHEFVVNVDRDEIAEAAKSLRLTESGSLEDLRSGLRGALLDLEIAINDLDPSKLPPTSVLGRPVQRLLKALAADDGIKGKKFFFLIDEFENLTDRQQLIVNTLVKHAGDHDYTFKIGVRETGHREHATLNPNEHLIAPADYAYIDIGATLDGNTFAEFAKRVCDSRLSKLRDDDARIPDSILGLFPSLSEEEEAEILGVAEKNSRTRMELAEDGASPEDLVEFDCLSPMSRYLVRYWSESTKESLRTTLKSAIERPREWDTRLKNYQYAMLFTIRSGKRGHRKYYAGWATYTQMCSGNIRYLLQLVHEALRQHLESAGTLTGPISYPVQTNAAAAVGERVVRELQGLSASGGDLTRLTLGLGRVFQVMAAQPQGHSPEVTQFRLSATPSPEVEELLNLSVMHLAVRRFTTDKMAAASGQVKDYSYQLHPIFSPFFVFSYRKKRRIDLSPDDIMGLVRTHRQTIPKVLLRSKRSDEEALPDQLTLFREYFNEID